MIVLVHQIYLLLQWSFYTLWRRGKDDDEIDGKLLTDDSLTRNEIIEEVIVSKHYTPPETVHITKIKIDESLNPPETVHITKIKIDESLNFPFLVDKQTISYIKKSKTMFIMRGVSGTGKSTLVNKISEIYSDGRDNVHVCSADHYFMTNGEYKFDNSQLSVAHDKCSEKAKQACFNKVPVVVIDNTNVRRWEMGNYFNLAITYNYPVVIVKPKTPWCNDPETLAKFNKHGVTSDVIRSKLALFEEVTPLYYGWFLDEQNSDLLYHYGRKSLEECYKIFPIFKDFLQFQSPDLFQAIEKELNDCMVKCTEWYSWHFPELRHIISNDLIYARVVKKLGHRRNMPTTNLSNVLPRDKVKEVEVAAKMSMGTDISDEDIILITDLCEQIIELTEYKDQMEVFFKNPVSENCPKLTSRVADVVGPLLLSHSNTLENEMSDNFKLNSSKILHCTAKFMGTKKYPAPGSDTYPNEDIVQSSYGSVHNFCVTRITVTPRTIGAKVKLSEKCLRLYDKPQEKERHGKGDNSLEFGCAAHVTIGTADGVKPAKTNDDLLDILEEEMHCKLHNIKLVSHKCAIGSITHVAKDLFVVDLARPITMQGLFTGFYGGNFGSPQRK